MSKTAHFMIRPKDRNKRSKEEKKIHILFNA